MAETKENLRPMVRLIDADVEGTKSVYMALRKVKGVSFSFANAVCNVIKIDKNRKIGSLSDAELGKIEDVIKNPLKYKLLKWLLNRQNDYDSGDDKHLTTSDLRLQKDFDLKRLKKIKSYRGMRHQAGLPVRGQRTKGHFRKGSTVGVKRRPGAKKGR